MFISGLKKFAIAFVVAVLILVPAALILFSSLEDVLTGSFSKSENEISEILNGDDEEKPGGAVPVAADNTLSALDGDSFTVLVVMTDYRPDVYDDYEISPKEKDAPGMFLREARKTGAAKICLLRCSKETGRYVVVPVSPLTNVVTSAGNERLYSIYTDYGIDYFKAKIESITGLKIDRYAVINCTEIGSFVSALGAVWCPVPCEIYTNGTEYISATAATAAKVKDPGVNYTRLLEVCEDYIGPSSMGLLLFKDYANGVEDELTVSAGYLKGVASNFAKFASESSTAYWGNVSSYMKETDIDGDFFSSHLALIGAYTSDIAKTVNVEGIFKEAGEDGEPVFEVDIPHTVDALSLYR